MNYKTLKNQPFKPNESMNYVKGWSLKITNIAKADLEQFEEKEFSLQNFLRLFWKKQSIRSSAKTDA